MVLSILIYNVETWMLTELLIRRLRVFEMSWLPIKRIAGVARLDRVRNEDIRNNLKIKRDIIEKVELRRIEVARMDQNRLQCISKHCRVNGGTRARGRPRKRSINMKKEL